MTWSFNTDLFSDAVKTHSGVKDLEKEITKRHNFDDKVTELGIHKYRPSFHIKRLTPEFPRGRIFSTSWNQNFRGVGFCIHFGQTGHMMFLDYTPTNM